MSKGCPECGGVLAEDGLCWVCAMRGTGESAASASASGTDRNQVRRFGDYDLIGEIGHEGAMGAVYYARQRSTNRMVALKMLRPERMRSAELADRFRLEMRAAAELEHPSIIPVYEIGQHDGIHFFTMKLVQGGSLSWQIQNGTWRLSTEDEREFLRQQRAIATLVARIAKGVQHAHSRGVIHRDLKPGNILIDLDGAPFIADFGLAKHFGSDLDLTQSLATLGTPTYMAPEQLDGGGRNITTATDVWALGIILYELLAGHPPFQAESPFALAGRIQTELAKPLRQANSSIHKDLETICMRCLNKDPYLRFHTAGDLAADLERFVEGARVKSSHKAFRPTRRWFPTVSPLAWLIILAQSALIAAILLAPERVFRLQTQKSESSRQGTELQPIATNLGPRTIQGSEARLVPELPAPNSDGWITVFDGRTLYGFHPDHPDITSGRIAIRDGKLIMDGSRGYFRSMLNWNANSVAIRATGKRGTSFGNFLLIVGPYSAWRVPDTHSGFGYDAGGRFQDIAGLHVPYTAQDRKDQIEFEFQVTGGRLILLVDGVEVLNRPAPLQRDGYSLGVAAQRGFASFRKLEIREL